MQDPVNDEPLLHYLQNRRHLAGVSKKQCKRIERLAEKYYWSDNTLWYTPNLLKLDCLLEVPQQSRRHDIIDQSHLLGHFQVQTTLERIRRKYYWPHMLQDVEAVIRQCQPCRQNQFQVSYDHPAISLPITGIFDRVGMDLVLGFPETEHGYKGLLVITEYLTKYPYVVPITSKKATEIATALFSYISFFGPPKELLSDQGKEFLNTVVDKLSTICGIERKVTAPYHPRTNGLTERFNHTLVDALRKHVDTDPINWHKWIPYILMAYRTRKHTTTGFTPFELMFGRPMLTFQDWTPKKPENEVQELLVRSKEIKDLIETTHPDTISHIVQQQVRQRKIQNDSNNITTDIIRDGSTVYVRSMKIQNKLKDKYYGPYTVKGRTDTGNYILNNLRGTGMRQSYPLAHLKIMEESEPRIVHSYEIGKILNHRDFHGTMEYLIQWKDLPDDENSWLRETEMDSIDLIHDYWNDKTRPADLLLSQSKHKYSKSSHAPRSSFLIQLLFWFSMLTVSSAQDDITGTFQLCDIHAQKNVLDMKLPCSSPIQLPQSTKLTVWHVLNKRKFMIDGKAIVCKKHIIRILAGKNFPGIGKNKEERAEDHIEVSREECASMWDTKLCDSLPMECLDNNCKYYREPVPTDFSFFDPVTFKTVYCEASLIPLQRELLTDVIAIAKFGACYAKDASCRIGRTIMIWPESVIHPCEFTHLESGLFLQSHNFIYTPTDTHHKKTQGANHLLFELETAIPACGTNVFPTKEGLFVSNNMTAITSFQAESISLATIPYLELYQIHRTAEDDKLAKFKHNGHVLHVPVAIALLLSRLPQQAFTNSRF